MAFESLGLGATVLFNTQQIQSGSARARDEFGRFVKTVDSGNPVLGRLGASITGVSSKLKAIGAGFNKGTAKMATGFRDLSLGFAPVSLGIGAALSQAASFEKQMSGVGAVSRASSEDMVALSQEARKMGIVSVFSATQAAEGMEFMARAGAKPAEIIAGLGGVMNAAAADGIELAESADIVARITKGLGKEWSEAAHIADVLALTSAKSNTNILALGESFTYGVSQAKAMNIPLEETAAIFGKLADAGLRGSMGGTAFTNMLVKLSKPTTKGKEILEKFGVALTTNDGKLRKISAIVSDFNEKLVNIKSTTERASITQEVFGIRGARAFNALATAGEDAVNSLENSLIRASDGEGAALEMSKRRLDNFAGSLTLLKSSLEGLSIGFFGPLLKPFATTVRHFTEGFNQVLLALNEINDATDETGTDFKKLTGITDRHGLTAVNIAFGLRDAIDAVKRGWEFFVAEIKKNASWLQESIGGPSALRNIVKFAALFTIVAAAIAPVGAALLVAKFILGGIISVAVGLATSLAAVFWPVTIAIGAVALAWQLLKKENESFYQTATRVWGDIKTWIVDVWQNAILPMWRGIREGFLPAIEVLGQIWGEIISNIKLVFSDLFSFISESLGGTTVDWKFVGQVIGAVIGAIATAILTLVKFAIPIIASIGKAVYKVFSFVWNVIDNVITQIAEGFASLAIGFQDVFSGNIVRGLARIGTSLLDFVLKPLRMLIEGALMLSDALNIDVPEGVRKFAKEGFTGLTFQPDFGREEVKTRGELLEGLGIAQIKPLVQSREDIGKLTEPMIPSIEPIEAAIADPTKTAIGLTKIVAEKGGVSAEQPPINVDATVVNQQTLNVPVDVKVDGEQMSLASGKHRAELQERSGFKATPWQRRMLLEQGAVPMVRR